MKKQVPVCLDFESYYDTDYSLTKLSTVEYVRDPRWEVHMVSVKAPALGLAEPTRYVGDADVQYLFRQIRDAQKHVDLVCVAHNNAFDALVARERYGVEFRHHFDTSLMCRWVLGNTLKDARLETLADHLDLRVPESYRQRAFAALNMEDDGGRKMSAALAQVKGKRLADIHPQLLEAYGIYCDGDVDLTWQAFTHLAPRCTAESIVIQNYYINALLDMPLVVDVPLLSTMRDDYADVREAEVLAFVDAVGHDVAFGSEGTGTLSTYDAAMKLLRSKDKFAALLERLGVPDRLIPRKAGKPAPDGTPRTIWAFDKASMMLDDLAGRYDDGDSLVPEACRLRLEYNTSAVESKLTRFIAAGRTGGWAMHVKPFGAANTARHAGASGTGSSPQNLKRAKKPHTTTCGTSIRYHNKLGVRDAIQAPEGYGLNVSDLSGIELRTVMFFCNDAGAIEILSDPHRDMYSEDGTVYFGTPVSKATPDLRQAAKVADLSCQYLVSAKRIHHQARLWGIPMSHDVASLLHAMYRDVHVPVVNMWSYLRAYLNRLVRKDVFEEYRHPCLFTDKGIRLPNGFWLRYPGIEATRERNRVSYTYFNAAKRCRVNLHEGMVMENIGQGLATAVMNDMHLRIQPRAELLRSKFCGTVHDEMVYCSPLDTMHAVQTVLQEEMAIPPAWWPELVVTSEGDYGHNWLEYEPGEFKYVSAYGLLK